MHAFHWQRARGDSSSSMTAPFAKPGSARENKASQTTARRRRRGRGEGRSRFCAATLPHPVSAGLLFEKSRSRLSLLHHHQPTRLSQPLQNGISSFGTFLSPHHKILPNDLQYPILANLLEKYPRAASGLFQAYNDIIYG